MHRQIGRDPRRAVARGFRMAGGIELQIPRPRGHGCEQAQEPKPLDILVRMMVAMGGRQQERCGGVETTPQPEYARKRRCGRAPSAPRLADASANGSGPMTMSDNNACDLRRRLVLCGRLGWRSISRHGCPVLRHGHRMCPTYLRPVTGADLVAAFQGGVCFRRRVRDVQVGF